MKSSEWKEVLKDVAKAAAQAAAVVVITVIFKKVGWKWPPKF